MSRFSEQELLDIARVAAGINELMDWSRTERGSEYWGQVYDAFHALSGRVQTPNVNPDLEELAEFLDLRLSFLALDATPEFRSRGVPASDVFAALIQEGQRQDTLSWRGDPDDDGQKPDFDEFKEFIV
jgi:hypothetical protein